MRRRSLLLRGLAAACASVSPAAVHAQRPGATGGPLRLGADFALVDSGLAHALQRAFGRDTGIGVEVVAGAALAVLEALAAGEFDAGLLNAPEAEARLDKQGLVYDRRPIAAGEFILVGPVKPRARGAPAMAPLHSIAGGLTGLNEAATAQPGALVFLSANDGSGCHIVEQAAWRSARIAPQAPWYRPAAAGGSLVAQARTQGAWAIVERGAWNARGGAPLSIVVERDPELAENVHAMRSFHSPHPAGKIFIAWIADRRGRAVVASHSGYRAAAA